MRGSAETLRRLLLAGLLGLAAGGQAVTLSAAEQAGRLLYREGVGASGQGVVARAGAGGATVPGQAVPCANCHGRDGLGRAEGAVLPPPILWSDLVKPWGHEHGNGRRHGPFDEALVARAVTEGIDPAGQRLDPTMPRYALGRDDVANLVAYLKRLEQDADPGVHHDVLRVGTLAPAAGPLAEPARQVQRVLSAYLDDLNAAGGLYGRRIEMVQAPKGPASDPLAGLAALERGGDVLALLAPMAVGTEAAMAAWAEEARMPVVGPFTVLGAESGAGAPHTFYVQSGVREQVRALVAHAADRLGIAEAPVSLVVADDPLHRSLADAMRSQCAVARCGRIVAHAYAPGALDVDEALRVHAQGQSRALFFLGPEADLARLLRAADAAGTYPVVLLPGVLGARVAAQAPAGFDGRLRLAYPSAPADLAGAEFVRFRDRHGLQDGPVALQAVAYAAAGLLTEGLRRGGRAVSREKLVAALESLRGFRTGAAPPLSFGPGRRVGALGSHVVVLDAKRRGFAPTGPWQRLD